MSTEAPLSERPLRADARRNRERVLAAARAALAEHGLDAQMDDIAARAGVGVGTVYRHFPTKDALVEALVADRWKVLADAAEASATIEDAWEALRDYLWRCARLQLENRAWAQLTSELPMGGGAGDELARLVTVTQQFIDRARAAGVVREDADAHDVAMLMCATCGVMQATGAHGGDRRWERFFELGVAGFRT